MTVKGLEKYISEVIPDACYKVNLKDLIKQENHCKTVLICANSVAPTVCKNLESLALFQPAPFKNNVRKYMENILSCGGKLIVIMGYPADNYTRYVSSEKIRMEKTIEILENLKEGNDEKLKTFETLTHYKKCCLNTLRALKIPNYEVLKSYETPQKTIIDHIKTNNNCPVVIANNSNFLIFEENFLYVKADYIDFTTLECLAYDKMKILKFFNLSSHEFPVFATLCGNEIISNNFLTNFYKRIEIPGSDKFKNVAHYVASHKVSEENFENFINDISSSGHTKELLRKGLALYKENKNFLTSFHLPTLIKNNKNLFFQGNILRILYFNRCKIQCNFENLKDPTIRSSIQLFKPLRQKIYGILLHGISNQVVKEFYFDFSSQYSRDMLMHTKTCKIKYTKVNAIPSIEHPGLKILWLSKDVNVNEIKLKITLKAVDKNLDLSHMKNVPTNILLPILVLYYLNFIPNMTFFHEDFELKALIIVVLLVNSGNNHVDLNSLTYEMPDYRAMDLSAKFKGCFEVICLLNEACGFVVEKKKSCLCNYFDDVLFQKVYKKLKENKTWSAFTKNFTLNKLFDNYLNVITEKK